MWAIKITWSCTCHYIGQETVLIDWRDEEGLCIYETREEALDAAEIWIREKGFNISRATLHTGRERWKVYTWNPFVQLYHEDAVIIHRDPPVVTP